MSLALVYWWTVLLLKSLVLLVPGVACLARPDIVRDKALEIARDREFDDDWQDLILTEEFVWSVRLAGGMLVMTAALLLFAVV